MLYIDMISDIKVKRILVTEILFTDHQYQQKKITTSKYMLLLAKLRNINTNENESPNSRMTAPN